MSLPRDGSTFHGSQSASDAQSARDSSEEPSAERSIQGVITDSLGGGIAGARIVLRRAEAIAGETRSAADGSYGFDLEPGDYLVEVQAPGFEEGARAVVVAVGAPQQVDFELALSGLTEEIMVTANKIEEDPQRVPASATVLGERAVAESRMLDFHTVHEYVPNLRSADFAGRGGFSYLSIRGQGNTFASVDPSATVYVDGVPYSDFYSYSQTLYDVDRLEVLRGPQSTLYGGFSQAGVVNVISREPGSVLEVDGRLAYERYDRYDARFKLSGPLVQDKLFLGVAGVVNGGQSFIRNSVSQSRPDQFQFAGRARLRYTPTEPLEINLVLSGDRIDDESGYETLPTDIDAYNQNLVALGFTSEQVGRFERATDYAGFRESDKDQQAVHLRWSGDRVELTSVTSRRDNSQSQGFDFDETPASIFQGLGEQTFLEWYQEFRVSSPADETASFSWIAGLAFNDYEQTHGGRLTDLVGAFGGPPGFNYTVYDSGVDGRNLGVFGQVSRRWNDAKLGLTAGLRYDDAKRDGFQEPGGFLGAGYMLSTEDDQLLPKIAVDYRLSDTGMVYTSVAAGWKPGGINPFAPNGILAEYRKETSWTFEGGAKTSWLGGRLVANVAGFITKLDDYQDTVLLNQFEVYLGNAEAVSISGMELDLAWRSTGGLEVTGGFGYAAARYDAYVRNPATGFRLDGFRVPQIPDYDLDLVAQYRFRDHWLVRAELVGAGDFESYRYTAPDASSGTEESLVTETIDGYVVANFRAGFENVRIGEGRTTWGLYAFLNNATDERYFMNTEARTPQIGAYSGFMGLAGIQRTFGVQLIAGF